MDQEATTVVGITWVLTTVAVLTVGFVVGYLTGRHKKPNNVAQILDWHDHWVSVMWVTRRKAPDLDRTVDL